MAFRDFNVENRKGLRQARADDFPNLAVIAGPNGSGKSTLLYELYSRRTELAEPGTKVAYLGPHRVWRRTTTAMWSMGEIRPSFNEYLRESAIPHWRRGQPAGFHAVQPGVQREPTGPDDAFSFVKSSMVRTDFRLQNLLREVWEAEGHRIEEGRVPDIFKPLRDAFRALLPHLDFTSIDSRDDDDIKVHFRRVDGQYDDQVEFDDLSSGEKSAIGLILPTVEGQIARLLGDEAESNEPLPTTIIDEPEQHLHPSLQVLLLDYLERLAETGQAQFILSTHSPTIVDSITDGLYLLAPRSQVPDGNQLLSLGSTASRLDAMRALTGATHLITRCRPIIYLEGERPAEKPISDQRLVEIFIPEATGWVLVSASGQREVVAAAQKLREAVTDPIPALSVFAIVDSDQHQASDPDWVVQWPVCMIENLLLDPEAIWAVLQPLRESTDLKSADEVRDALLNIASELKEDEVRLRLPALQKGISIRVRPANRDDLHGAIERARAEFTTRIDTVRDEVTAAAWDEAASKVEEIINDGRQLDAFRGKPIFDKFFDEHANRSGLTKKAFAYAVAGHAAGRSRSAGLVASAVKRISTYIPAELPALAIVLSNSHNSEQTTKAVQKIQAARAAWEQGTDLPTTLEELRSIGASLAQAADSVGASELGDKIRRATAQIAVRSARQADPT
ncbi:AAA family ATPase [Mycobacterium sp. MMS18-G62]